MEKRPTKDVFQQCLLDLMVKRPTKDVFQQCLLDLTIEKNRIVGDKIEDKKLLDEIDKVMESIQLYLRVTSK